MTSRISRRNLLAAAAPIVSRLEAQRGGSTGRPPMNVIFMVADDLNNALGCYGNPIVKTPHIDRLAAKSVLFDRAYCQFPLCAPSRASFLSGRRPETTRVLSLDIPTRKYMRDVVMLPELFKKNGYFSGQTGKIFHTGPDHDDPQSWHYMLPESGKSPPESEIVKQHKAGQPRNHSMAWMQLRTPDADTPDGIVVRKASELMRKCVSESKPFFLGVGFRRPHSPYAAPKQYFDLYDPAKIPLPRRGDPKSLPAAAWYELANQPPLSDREQREYMAAYYACNSYMDVQVGYLMSSLDELKLWDRTAIVFIGDNGYHNGEHGMWHKMTLFEESMRVPLIVYAPGARGNGRKCAGIVEMIDLYPTFTDLCGLKPPQGLEGVSLRPWLDDPTRAGKNAAFGMVGRNDDRNESHHSPTYFGRTVRTERWRYIEWDEGRRGHELYDERADPGEMKNLAGIAEHAGTVKQLSAMLRSIPMPKD
ncbi:MAG: sulfatase [Bryobacterales bacterium]|nr:sulfatase [Bryobacterales bacterium]